jgi:hypothetical protein
LAGRGAAAAFAQHCTTGPFSGHRSAFNRQAWRPPAARGVPEVDHGRHQQVSPDEGVTILWGAETRIRAVTGRSIDS